MKEYGKIKCNNCSYTGYVLSSRRLCRTCDMQAEIQDEKERQSYYLDELEKYKLKGVFSMLEKISPMDLNNYISDSLAASIIDAKQSNAFDFLLKLEIGKSYISESGHLRKLDDNFIKERLKIATPIEKYSYFLSKKNIPINIFSSVLRLYSFLKRVKTPIFLNDR